MTVAIHLLLFLLAASVLWYFSGLLIEATEAVAKRFNRSSFTVAFFVLGFLTSIGEISVLTNSIVEGVPQIAVGNIIGSAFVTVLFIVPILAIVGRGVHLKNTLNKKHLALTLCVALLPALFVLDGNVLVSEGVICLLAYATLFYFIEGNKWWWWKDSDSVPDIIEEVEEELVDRRHATTVDIIKIIGGAVMIFIAGNLLVDETVYISGLLSISSSVVGLVLLSIGTNVPELVIAVRAIRKGNVDVAFGDYLGSAVAVSALFGFLSIINGDFLIDAGAFFFTTILITLGFVAFFIASYSKNEISRIEGVVLVSFYSMFILSQVANLVWLS